MVDVMGERQADHVLPNGTHMVERRSGAGDRRKSGGDRRKARVEASADVRRRRGRRRYTY